MARAAATLKRHIELDFVRGIALLMVMAFHFEAYDRWFPEAGVRRAELIGWSGVDLFFVLSGFLVGGLLMREWKSTGSVDAWRFLKRRAFKIWPSYYLLILVAAVLRVEPLNRFLWQNLLNVQNYFPSTLSHTWSLAVEEHFYLGSAALLTLWSWRRWKPRALIWFVLAVALAVEAGRAYASFHGHPNYFETQMRMDGLLLGVALAALQNFEPGVFHALREQRVALGVVAISALVYLYLRPATTDSPWFITATEYGCAAALLLLSRPSHRPRSLPYRAVARLGIYSYGIYLWHLSILRPIGWLLGRLPHSLISSASTVLPYLCAISLGVVMTKLVELPGLRLRERLVPPKTPEPRVPVG